MARWTSLALLWGCGVAPAAHTGDPRSLDTGPPADTDTRDATGPDTHEEPDPGRDTAEGAPSAAWRSTIAVDGDLSDWAGAEQFTTSSGTSSWITWDATHLYVAVQHPDVAAGDAEHRVVLTLGHGGGGATIGVTHGSQTPRLAFRASHVLRWTTDGSHDGLLTWDGAAWQETSPWLGTAGSAVGEDPLAGAVELGVPFAAIGVTDVVEVHVGLVYEGVGAEATYAATPASSLVDGYDPDYIAYYRFDLDGTAPPNGYAAFTGLPFAGPDTGSP